MMILITITNHANNDNEAPNICPMSVTIKSPRVTHHVIHGNTPKYIIVNHGQGPRVTRHPGKHP